MQAIYLANWQGDNDTGAGIRRVTAEFFTKQNNFKPQHTQQVLRLPPGGVWHHEHGHDIVKRIK